MSCLCKFTEYSNNYRKTTGSLWNYYRDEPNSGAVGNINYSKSFDYKTSTTGKLEGNNIEKDVVETVVPLKYLSNFWKTLNIPLINCEVFLTLIWSENCVLVSKATKNADPDAETKSHSGGFLSMLLGTLGASLLGDLLTKKLS